MTLQGSVMWMLAGTLAVWSSMPAVFILAAIGLYYFISATEQKKTAQFIKYFSLPAVVWSANFLIYFFFILKSDAESDYLQNYHARYLIQHEIWKPESWKALWGIISDNINHYIGNTILAYTWALLFFVWGILSFIKERRREGLLLLLPIVLTGIASAMRYYSLIPRLNLFLLIFFFLIIMLGIRAAWQTKWKTLRIITIVSSLIAVGNLNWKHLLPRVNPVIEETREVMDVIANEIKEGDTIFANHEGAPVVKFYVQHYDQKQRFHSLKNFRHINWDENLVSEAHHYLNNNPGKRLWILWGHTPDEIIDEEARLVQTGYIVMYDSDKWRARAICVVKPKIISGLSPGK